MINTAFTGAAGLRQPLLRSNKTNKLARQRAALQLLSGAGSGRSGTASLFPVKRGSFQENA